MAAVKLSPIKSHDLRLWYIYHGILETATLEAIAPMDSQGNNVDYGKTLFHEVGAKWTWRVNKHFQIVPRGYVMIPGNLAEDMASTVDCGGSPCDGEDIGLAADIELRATF